jgi:uncharacterized protein (TIGR02391 family)
MVDMQRRIELLQAQIDEAAGGSPHDFDGWRERTRGILRAVVGQEHPAIERFNRIRYGLSVWSEATPRSAWSEAQEAGVRRGIAILEGVIHELRSAAPEGPELRPTGLHPWVSGAVAGLWDDGHHRQAVEEACRAVEVRLRSKLGVDVSGTALVTEAFNPSDPKPGHPRLRFREFEEGTQAWTDAHRGAMNFAQGCVMRIRNLVAHVELELDEQPALEALAAMSLLARWIEEGDVESFDEGGPSTHT